MKRILLLCVLVGVLVLGSNSALAGKVPEHPVIRPFPGSVLAEAMSQHQAFQAYDFYYLNPETRKREKKNIKGEYWRLLYEVRTTSGERVKNISKLEFFENYKIAALEKGGQVVYDDGTQMVFTLPRDDGGVTWCRVTGNAGLGQQDLLIVDEKGFKKTLTFGPAELKAALDKDGKVLLYGILFDSDKASLKPEANEQLQHIVALLLENPGLKLEVQGHTDNQGQSDYNMQLSQRRAETVNQYLQLFGISADRLTAKGYGETRPVAGNATEADRSKNRRVELVKIK